MDQQEIMTAQEVADLLRVSERTVYDWAKNGKIPSGRLGTSWRFRRTEVEKWIDKNLNPTKPDPQTNLGFADILESKRVILLEADNKRDALEVMVQGLVDDDLSHRYEEIRDAMFHRESLMSTGIGLGVGVPHTRMDRIERPRMAVGVRREGIADYDSIDSKPVQLIFMILAGKQQHAEHIKILAKISGLVRDPQLREQLLEAPTSLDVHRIVTHA
jgi:PTS system nitrogen regulatory IIA component